MIKHLSALTLLTPPRLAFAALALSGCAASLDFNSPSPLGQGVTGKYWHAPYFVDAPLYNPTTAYANPADILLQSYDAVASGSSVALIGTWHDPNESFHKGYSRLYVDKTGWGNMGPIAAETTTDFGWSTLAAGNNGSFVANFFASAAAAGEGVSAYFTGSSWNSYAAVTTLVDNPAWTGNANYTYSPAAVSTLDAFGRGYAFFTGANAGHLQAAFWQASNAKGLAASLQDTLAVPAANSGLTGRFDGVKQVCVSYELSGGTTPLQVRCVDTSGPTISFATAQTLSTVGASVAGHETASDGAGNIMAVFYQLDISGAAHVYANLISNGTAGTALEIGAAMSPFAGPTAAIHSSLTGVRPGVAHLGAGKFIAVWVGVASNTTALFYATYDPAAGWGTAAQVPATAEPYTTIPHHQALHVFSNGNGNAGFAVNKVVGSTLFLDAQNVRVTEVARWQTDNGWLAPLIFGNSCANPTLPTNSACTQRPTGVILPSGNSLVFFQDSDNNSQTVAGPNKIPGNRRLSVLEFKP